MASRESNILRTIDQHCWSREDEFYRSINSLVHSIISKPLAPILVIGGIGANIPMIGVDAIYIGLPSLISGILMCLYFRFNIDYKFNPGYTLTLQFFIMLISVLYIYSVAFQTNPNLKETTSPPIQLALICSLWVNFYLGWVLKIIVTNLVITTLSIASAYILFAPDTGLFLELFIGGYVIGTLVAVILLYAKKIVFYFYSQERSKNHHLVEQSIKSHYSHQTQMMTIGYSLVETMPLLPRKAILAEFDIGNSSKYSSHESYVEKKNITFGRCYDLMMERYSYDRLNPSPTPYGNAYKFKELGDGFIFTVGYPFLAVNRDENEISFWLASKFMKIFNENMSEFSDLYAVVILCKSELRPFWTNPPAIQYDFEQRGVSKVGRISELRRSLISLGILGSGNHIIVDDELYDSLSPHLQRRFTKIELAELNISVRDWEEISFLYSYII